MKKSSRVASGHTCNSPLPHQNTPTSPPLPPPPPPPRLILHCVFCTCQQILIAPHTLFFPPMLHASCHQIPCVLIRHATTVDTLLTGAAGLPGSHTQAHTSTNTHTARDRERTRETLMLTALKINGERRITREARRVNF